MRLILNVVLIVSLVVGGFSVANIVNTAAKINHLRNEEIPTIETLYGNKSFQEDISGKMQLLIDYILKVQSLEDTKENKKILEKEKEYLERQYENYKYQLSYTGEDGKEVVISNTKESTKELKNELLYLNYSGYKTEAGYTKTWSNTYRGKETDYTWLNVNEFIRKNGRNNLESRVYIGEELVENIDLYKWNENTSNAFLELYYKEEINETILEKLYGENFGEVMEYATFGSYEDIEKRGESKKKGKIKESSSLSNSEKKELQDYIEQSMFLDEYNVNRLYIPLAVILGTPKEYNISLAVEEEYFLEQQKDVEWKLQDSENDLEELQWKINQYEETLGVFCVIFFVVFLLLIYVCGRKYGTEEIQYLAIDHFPTEVIVLIEGIFSIFSLCYSSAIYRSIAFNVVDDNGNTSFMRICLAIITLWTMVQLFLSLVRKWKGKTLYQTSLLGHSMSKIQVAMNQGRIVKRAMVVAIVVPAILICMLLYGLWHMDESGEFMLYAGGILTVLFWILGVRTLYHHCISLEKIQDGIRKVKAGDIKYQIENDNRPGILNQLAKDINSLSDGLENAVNEMMKSERLKTELISNVSHDIKTPLTSIITYVDLLKKEEVESEKAKEYIEVLEQKSQRLKILTDDLFEAAKASSGAMQMEKTILDMGSLLKQGIGEFSEKFEKMQLKIRNEVEEGCYWVEADGRLAWRIMENIFTNVAKYALEGSRVYVEVKEMEKEIEVTVKNISGCELNISAEELMERFTRGERSRNTEGSGLGLNIAQSLAELQGGQFYVEIDGDLFKSVLSLPKVEKIEIKEGN